MAQSVLKNIVDSITEVLNKSGIMFRIFSRVKGKESISSKLCKKENEYRANNKKMQDLLALRITLYFSDDVEIVHQYLKTRDNFVDETIDIEEEDKFCPKRLNIVMRIQDEDKEKIQLTIKQTEYPDLIDYTYEIQIRTILSEGWHEVEHDLRYKCKDDWDVYKEESRLLNGVFATLETAEWSMLRLFDKMSYMDYKEQKWSCMVRNKMRLRLKGNTISPQISQYLNEHENVVKNIFRVDRKKVISLLIENRFTFPLTYDTIIYLLNHIDKIDKDLAMMADTALIEELNSSFGKFN